MFSQAEVIENWQSVLDKWPEPDIVAPALTIIKQIAEDSQWHEWQNLFHRGEAKSNLTAYGIPYEINFTTFDSALRYVCEIQPPQTTKDQALEGAIEICRRNGQPPLVGQFDFLKEIQQEGLLVFGAWLGVRQNAQGTNFKIYADIPDEIKQLPVAFHPTEVASLMKPLLWGSVPGKDGAEIYFHLKDNTLSTLNKVLDAFNGPTELFLDRIHKALASLGCSCSHTSFVGEDIGLGVNIGPNGLKDITVYQISGEVLYTDQRIISSLKKAFKDIGSPHIQTAYDLFNQGTEPDLPEERTRHGMLGICVKTNGEWGIYTGLVPPFSFPKKNGLP